MTPAPVRASTRSAPTASHLVDLPVGPAVVVEQRGPQRRVVRVEQHHARHAAGDADALDRRRVDAGVRARLGHDRERRGEPRVGSASDQDGAGEGFSSGREARPTRPRSGSSTTALSAVVPTSRPSSTGRQPRAAARKRRTRSRSTGFQVPPSTLRSEPTITPSTSGRYAAMLAALAPVLR